MSSGSIDIDEFENADADEFEELDQEVIEDLEDAHDKFRDD